MMSEPRLTMFDFRFTMYHSPVVYGWEDESKASPVVYGREDVIGSTLGATHSPAFYE